MTEAELIDLAQAKEPGEFTTAEIGRLRRAVRRSPAVRDSVAARIRTEEYLTAALGRPSLAVEPILRRQAERVARRSSLARKWLLATGAVLAVAMAVGAWSRVQTRQPEARVAGMRPPQAAEERPVAVAAPLPADDPQAALQRQPPAFPVANPPTTGAAETDAAEPPPSAAVVVAPEEADLSPLPSLTAAEAAALTYARPGPADRPPSKAGLEAWFAPIEGRPLTFGEQQIEGRICGTLDGLARLARPLAGRSLRLALHEPAGLRLHCWSGDRGVSIVLGSKQGPWWAYATTRGKDGPLPDSLALAGRDGWRLQRSPAASLPVQVLDLRQQAGRLLVSTGDVTILDLPAPGPIDELICEGRATFRQIELLPPIELPPVLAARSAGGPATRGPHGDEPSAADPPVRDERVPAEQEWGRQQLPAGTRLVLDDEGGIELVAESPPQPAWALCPLPDRGAWVWTFELTAADPGTGLCLGDASGNPVRVVRLMRDKAREGAVLCEAIAAGDNSWESDGKPYDRPVPLVVGCPRIRLLSCGGMLRCWIAAAGSDEWVEAFDPICDGNPQAVWVGLHAAAGQGSRSIRLGRCVGTLPEPLAALGRDAEHDLAVLGSACPKAEALAALERLGTAAAASDHPLPDKLAMLHEIAVRAPVWNDPAAGGTIARLYEAAGLAAAEAGHGAAYTALAVAQQTAPLAIAQPSDWFPAALARRELLQHVGGRDWAEAARLADRAHFFGFDAGPHWKPLEAWAGEAGRRLAEPQPASRAGLQPARGVEAAWLHPLVIDVSKEAFNFHADFEAARAAGAWEDAAAILAAAGAAMTGGLIPDATDPDLVMRIDAVGDAAVAAHPEFHDAMRATTERPGLVRFRMLAARGDAGGVAGVARAFPGTQAAAEAEAWLAARALAVGRFTAARRHLDRPLPWASAEVARRLAAMAELLGAAARGPAEGAEPLPAGPLTATVLGRLEGDVGVNPGGVPDAYRRGWPGVAAGSIDWAGRQAALVAAGDDLLLANRFQLACFTGGDPQPRWRLGLAGAAGDTHGWTGQPMRPVVSGDTIFVRLLEKPGPKLVATAVADGAERWSLVSTEACQLVSDPLLGGNALFVVAATKGDGKWQLRLRRLDPADGTVEWDRQVAELRDSWWAVRDCQLAAGTDGTLVIACGGSLIACDDEGSVRWKRRLPWVPPATDPLRLEQEHRPPVLSGSVVYALLPGVPGVVAVDRSTGRRLWSCPLAAARRIIALAETEGADGLLAVETSTGLVGLRAADGSVAWRLPLTAPLDGSFAAVTTAGRTILTGFDGGPAADGGREPVLLRVDAGGGGILSRQAMPPLADAGPRIAPVVPGPGSLRILFGRGPDDPTRDLIVIAP